MSPQAEHLSDGYLRPYFVCFISTLLSELLSGSTSFPCGKFLMILDDVIYITSNCDSYYINGFLGGIWRIQVIFVGPVQGFC